MIKEIVCNNLSYSIDSKRILNSLSVRLNQDKIGLIGSNGVGKATLIRLLVGQLQPNEGSIFINGMIGYLPQDFSGYWQGSIAVVLGIEQMAMVTSMILISFGDDWNMRERALKVLSKVNLGYQNLNILRYDQTITENFKRLNTHIAKSDYRTGLATFLFSQETVDKPVNCLSGGEKMRAAMACIFMGDNPHSWLFSMSRQTIWIGKVSMH